GRHNPHRVAMPVAYHRRGDADRRVGKYRVTHLEAVVPVETKKNAVHQFMHRCRIRCPRVFFFQAEDGIRDKLVTGVQTCALPIYLAPWEIGSSWTLSASNGLYRSTDGGTTWRQIGTGLPGAAEGLGRIGLATSQSAPGRMYAVVGASKGGGLYRSDDGGEGWGIANADERLWGRDGDFNEVKVDPSNADVVYVANVVTWQSLDGGHTFTAFRGAPGGDDYHRLWIDPGDPAVILLTGDQGAVVTVNGGETWSSWYNQPTAQFYHVATDRRFPYWVYGGQQ